MDFNPQNIAATGQLPTYLFNRGLKSLDQAQRGDQLSLEGVMAEQQRKAQMHPLEMQQKQATLADTQAVTQGRQIQNEWAPKQNQADLDAKLFKLTQDKSIEELDKIKRDAYTLMMSNDETAQQRGRQVYERMPDIIERRKAAEAAAAEAAAQRKTTERGQNMNLQGIREQIQARPPAATPEVSLDKLAARYIQAAQEAAAAGDMETAEKLHQMANIVVRAMAEGSGTALGNQPNPAAFPGREGQPLLTPKGTGLPPLPGMQPNQAPGQPTRAPGKLSGQAAEDWISRAMRANPGMSREQIIQEGSKLGKL